MKQSNLIYLADLYHDVKFFSGLGVALPLNIGFIGSYLLKEIPSAQIKLFKNPAELMEAIKEEPPMVLGLSNYMWNDSINNFMLKFTKSYNPNIVTVMGGPNIREGQDELKKFLLNNRSLDFFAPGAGEISFSNIVKFLLGGGRVGRDVVPGGAHVDGDDLIYQIALNPPGTDLSWIPSPYQGGLMDKFLEQDFIPMIETNRGCPFSCSFCVWGIASHKKLRFFPLDGVYADIEYIYKKKTFPYLIIADANFGISKRDINIAQFLSARCEKMERLIFWLSKNSIENNKEITKVLGKKSPSLVAFQSLDDAVLKNIKRSNISVEELTSFVPFVKTKGFETATNLLVGLPGQTLESHLTDVKKSFASGIDQILVFMTSALKGSELERDESRNKYGIKTAHRVFEGLYGIYNKELVFELDEVIVSTNDMSFEDMMFIRIFNFFLMFLWAMKHFVYPLSYIKAFDCDMTDFILNLISNIEKNDDALKALFADYRAEAEKEWFFSRKEAEEYYSKEKNREELLQPSIDKLNPKYLIKLYDDDEMMKILMQRMVRTASKICDDDRFSEEVFIKLFELSYERIFYMDIKDKDLNEIPVKKIQISPGISNEISKYLPDHFPKLGTKVLYTLKKDLFRAYMDYLEKINAKDSNYLSNPELRSTFLYTRFITYFYEASHDMADEETYVQATAVS